MKQEALKLARQLLWRYRHEIPIGHQPYMICHQVDEAFESIDEALAQPEFIKHEVENADDWSEWVCPNPESYLMKCCDCGLVHEAQFKVVRYKSEDDREDCDMVDDPNLQAVFRMRRSEQWLPEDTAQRAGGLPMAQPEQDTIQRLSALVRAQQITIDKLEAQTEQQEQLRFEVDGEMLTASQLIGVELFNFQQATKCDTAAEFLAQPEQEPVCPDCKAKVLYECVACSSNNYPPKTKQEPVTIWYMRDNHTFKKLSADVSIALIEIEQEFNEGYTYGMLCSKRKGFPNVHASGEKKRLEFFAECKKTLEEWLPNTTPPQREPKPFFTEANGFPQEFVPKDRHKVEQEPVAWMHTKIEGVAVPHRPADLDKHPDRWEALYKAPPPCPTCEALARTVMMDQTGRDA